MRTYTVELDEAKLRSKFGNTSLVILCGNNRSIAVECNPAVRPGTYGKRRVRHSLANIEYPDGVEIDMYLYHRGKLSKLATVLTKPRCALRAIVTFVARVVGYANMMGWNIDGGRLMWGAYDLGAYLCLFEGKLGHLFDMSYVAIREPYHRVVGFEIEYVGHGIATQTDEGVYLVLADKSIAFKFNFTGSLAKIIENSLVTIRDVILTDENASANC